MLYRLVDKTHIVFVDLFTVHFIVRNASFVTILINRPLSVKMRSLRAQFALAIEFTIGLV